MVYGNSASYEGKGGCLIRDLKDLESKEKYHPLAPLSNVGQLTHCGDYYTLQDDDKIKLVDASTHQLVAQFTGDLEITDDLTTWVSSEYCIAEKDNVFSVIPLSETRVSSTFKGRKMCSAKAGNSLAVLQSKDKSLVLTKTEVFYATDPSKRLKLD